MKKFIGLLMSTFMDVNRVRLSNDLISDVVKKQPSVPVTINFAGQSIGSTNKFEISGDGLRCEFELDDSKIPPLMDKAYIVPGFDSVGFHYDGDVRVIDTADLTEVSISLLPFYRGHQPIKPQGDK